MAIPWGGNTVNNCLITDDTLYNFFLIGLTNRVDRVLSFFSSRPNWDPHILTRRRVCPPLPLVGGGGSREGVGGVPIRTRGQTLWYSRYICTLCHNRWHGLICHTAKNYHLVGGTADATLSTVLSPDYQWRLHCLQVQLSQLTSSTTYT